MAKLTVATLAVLGLAAGAAAQARFEVASVKPSDPNASVVPVPMIQPPVGGRFAVTNASLRFLITLAYGVPDHQVMGGPDWMARRRFDINAKAPAEMPSMQAMVQMGGMLRALLEERFQLQVTRESREMGGYALVKTGAPPRLRPSSIDCAAAAKVLAEQVAKGQLPAPGDVACAIIPAPGAGGFRVRGTGQSVAQLAAYLTPMIGRPVTDETGLTGAFDFELQFDPAVLGAVAARMGIVLPGAFPESTSPALFTALQEQLGLKLESRRVPVDVVVVGRAELPTPD